MASLASLVVDMQLDSAALRKGLDEAKGHLEGFGKKLEDVAKAVVGLEAVKLAMEGVAKAGELMEQGVKDAAALGSGPARELSETFEKVGLATRQLGADLMSDLAPALNSLISWFTDGADFGKILAKVAEVLGQAFRDLIRPFVAVAGAIKGLIDGGNLESALGGAITAMAKLAEHGKAFAGSLLTATQLAAKIASMENINTKMNIGREATRMQDQFENLTGNRRQDKFAGATEGFGDFTSALHKWQENMREAADLTQKAAVAEAFGSKIEAEGLRLQADQATQAGEHAKLAADAFRMMKEKLIVDTQAINNIHFGLAESVKNVGLSASIKTQQYDNTYNPTKGFESFGAALDKQTKALENQAGLMAAAEMIEQRYGAAAQGTVLALKAQADAEGRSAEAAKVAADAFFAVKDRIRDQLLGALQLAGESFLSKIGQLGTTINDAIKGFQQGGIWGALAALVMDLLSMMDGWKDIQAIAQGALMTALKDMSKGLNSVISAIQPLMGAIESIAQAVHGVLGPILTLVGTILKGIAPLLEVLGLSLKVLSGTLGPLIQIIGGILDPIFKLMAVTLNPLVLVFMALKVAVDYVSLGFNMAINAIEAWINNLTGSNVAGNNVGGVIDAQSQVDTDTQKLKDFVDDWSKNPFGALNDLEQDDADKLKGLGNQTDKATTSLAKFNQQLTNLPDGFKYLADRFNAMAPVGAGSGWSSSSSSGGNSKGPGSGYSGGGKGTDPHGAGSGYAGGKNPPSIHINIGGSVVVEKDLISTIKKALSSDYFQVHGVPRPPGG